MQFTYHLDLFIFSHDSFHILLPRQNYYILSVIQSCLDSSDLMNFSLDFPIWRAPYIRSLDIMRRGWFFGGFFFFFPFLILIKIVVTKRDPSCAVSCSHYNLCQWNETSENFNAQYNLWKTVIYCVTLTFPVFYNLIGRKPFLFSVTFLAI